MKNIAALAVAMTVLSPLARSEEAPPPPPEIRLAPDTQNSREYPCVFVGHLITSGYFEEKSAEERRLSAITSFANFRQDEGMKSTLGDRMPGWDTFYSSQYAAERWAEKSGRPEDVTEAILMSGAVMLACIHSVRR